MIRELLYRIWLTVDGPVSLFAWNTMLGSLGLLVIIPIVWASKKLGE